MKEKGNREEYQGEHLSGAATGAEEMSEAPLGTQKSEIWCFYSHGTKLFEGTQRKRGENEHNYRWIYD